MRQCSPLTLSKNVDKVENQFNEEGWNRVEVWLEKCTSFAKFQTAKTVQQSMFKNYKNLPVYGDRVELFEKGHLSE